ncbi:MAG: AAA family ATPase [Oscillospiraceae bacterium]|nr:AAA family ATPase [Oscillospiraceae bacterium]
MGQVIAISSGKGGTGKTTLCAAVGSCLAAEGKRVLCIDADIGLRNLDISLGMAELASITFTDALSHRNSLGDATPHPEIPNLYLLSAPALDQSEHIQLPSFGALLESVRAQFDYCLIDSPAGVGEGFRLAVEFADRVILVAVPDPASLRDAAGTADRLRLMGKQNLYLVVNRVTSRLLRRLRWTVDDIMDETGLPLLGIVPTDERVVMAAASNTALIRYTDLGASLGFLHVTRRLMGKRVPLLRI